MQLGTSFLKENKTDLVMKKINIRSIHFNRSQIGKAQRYIRTHSDERLTLKKIATVAVSTVPAKIPSGLLYKKVFWRSLC